MKRKRRGPKTPADSMTWPIKRQVKQRMVRVGTWKKFVEVKASVQNRYPDWTTGKLWYHVWKYRLQKLTEEAEASARIQGDGFTRVERFTDPSRLWVFNQSVYIHCGHCGCRTRIKPEQLGEAAELAGGGTGNRTPGYITVECALGRGRTKQRGRGMGCDEPVGNGGSDGDGSVEQVDCDAPVGEGEPECVLDSLVEVPEG